MGKLVRKMFDRVKTVKAGSKPYTGIDPGRGTSNVATPIRPRNGGRRANTPLGGGQDQM
jgi:hypothetical protein